MTASRPWEHIAAPAPGEPVLPYVHAPRPSPVVRARVVRLVAEVEARLGPLEARLFEARWVRREGVAEIAAREGVSRTAVRRRLAAIPARLKAALAHAPLPDALSRAGAVLSEDAAAAVVTYLERRCQVHTARQLGRSQGWVARTMRRAVAVLREGGEEELAAAVQRVSDRATYGYVHGWRGREAPPGISFGFTETIGWPDEKCAPGGPMSG